MSSRIDVCDFCDELKEVTPHGFSGRDESEGTASLICKECLELKINEYTQMLKEFDQMY